MAGIKELKTRIKSIGSTRKITRAMQMVSAAKMRKAQQAALNSRTYSQLAWELIGNLMRGASGSIPEGRSAPDGLSGIQNKGLNLDPGSPMHSAGMEQTQSLLQAFPKATKTGIIIISTNKGLVGGFNANLMAKLGELENNLSHPSTHSTSQNSLGATNNSTDQKLIGELLVMGRKAKEYALRTNKNMMADFPKSDTWVGIGNIYPLAKMVSDLYKTGEYKNISIIYNHYVSTLIQKATVKQLLPFSSGVILNPNASEGEGSLNSKERDSSGALGMTPKGADYLFEPTPELVLNNLLPRIIESQIYQAVLESDASEHSARMVMMKNATEAAGDIIEDLTLTYNGLRQSKITTELSEITAGRIALE
jgi:F-type H+-transporting ATPase subunit gamma